MRCADGLAAAEEGRARRRLPPAGEVPEPTIEGLARGMAVPGRWRPVRAACRSNICFSRWARPISRTTAAE